MTRARRFRVSNAILRWIRRGCHMQLQSLRRRSLIGKGALQAMDRCKTNLDRVQSVLADGGYVGQPFAEAVKTTIGATVQIARRNQLHMFSVMPKRWVVERSFAWLEKCRRLWKNCERKLNTSLQFVHLAFLALLLQRL
ncbi:Transposase [Nitrosomonas sp. Nm58]|nr:Transposase [Nitrosomonas sp. Nm58]